MRPYVVYGRGWGGWGRKDHSLTPLSLAVLHQPAHAASDPDLPQGVGLVVSKKL